MRGSAESCAVAVGARVCGQRVPVSAQPLAEVLDLLAGSGMPVTLMLRSAGDGDVAGADAQDVGGGQDAGGEESGCSHLVQATPA